MQLSSREKFSCWAILFGASLLVSLNYYIKIHTQVNDVPDPASGIADQCAKHGIITGVQDLGCLNYNNNIHTQVTDVPDPDSSISDPCGTPRRITGVEDLLCRGQSHFFNWGPYAACHGMEPPTFLKQYKNPCWIQDGTFQCLPYFHLIGNAKCGTSDFFKRINLHPDILPNSGVLHKETFYWSRKRLRISTSAI